MTEHNIFQIGDLMESHIWPGVIFQLKRINKTGQFPFVFVAIDDKTSIVHLNQRQLDSCTKKLVR